MSKFRNISAAEFTFLGRDTETESPFVNQFFVEGKGNISKEQMQQAVSLATEKNPGISLQLKNHWAWRYWARNSNLPEVFEYSGPWQGNSSENTEVIDKPFNARTDILSTITLFTRQPGHRSIGQWSFISRRCSRVS